MSVHICPNCLTPVPEGEKYCPNCGYKIRFEIASTAKTTLSVISTLILWLGGAVVAFVGMVVALIFGIWGACVLAGFQRVNYVNVLGGFAAILVAGVVFALTFDWIQQKRRK